MELDNKICLSNEATVFCDVMWCHVMLCVNMASNCLVCSRYLKSTKKWRNVRQIGTLPFRLRNSDSGFMKISWKDPPCKDENFESELSWPSVLQITPPSIYTHFSSSANLDTWSFLKRTNNHNNIMPNISRANFSKKI